MWFRNTLAALLLIGIVILAFVATANAADDADVVFWKSVDHGNAKELRSYVAAFPHGQFVDLAWMRIDQLEHQPLPPSPPAPVKGLARVVDTGTLMVGDTSVSLYGVAGLGAPYDQQLTQYIHDQGGSGAVTCQPKDNNKWVCLTDTGEHDIAKVVLLNGAGRAASDAPPEYLVQQDQAKVKHVGIWQADQPQSAQKQNSSGNGGKRPKGGGLLGLFGLSGGGGN